MPTYPLAQKTLYLPTPLGPIPARPTVEDIRSHITAARELAEHFRLTPPDRRVPGTGKTAGQLGDAYELQADAWGHQLDAAIVLWGGAR